MVEGTDHHEVEKLRPFSTEELDKGYKSDQNKRETQKWQMLLEPALFGSMVAINLSQTSLQNFYLRTACTADLGFPSNVCNSGVGKEFRVAEEQSQMVVSSVNVSRSFIGALIATCVLLFVGPWSDCSGRRKPLLIMPLLGMTVMTSIILLLVTFPGATTVQVLYAVQIPLSLGGNFGLLLAASFSYLGDICHATGRDVTRTMGTHRATIQVAHVLGSLCGPLLYRHFGFYGVFPISLLMQVSSLIYVIVKVRDVNINSENKVSVFNWRLPFNAVGCLVKPREGHRRKIIFLMLIVALGDRIMLSAEVLLAYMFYRRKFNWDDIMFGTFLAYRNVISFLGTIIILAVLKRAMHLSDEVVGTISTVSYILSASGLVAAQSTVAVFILPVIGIISQGSQVVQRPLLNKQILPTEQGKIYSVMGALESATQTLSSPLYSLLYSKTVTSNPDAWLAPGIVLAIIQLLSYLWARQLGRNTKYETTSPKLVPLKLIREIGDKKEEANLLSKELSGIKVEETKNVSESAVVEKSNDRREESSLVKKEMDRTKNNL